MEIFARPDTQDDTTDVLYFGTDSYDGGNFVAFPERCGYAEALNAVLTLLTEPADESIIQQFHGFLQDWLFLGLLTEVFQRPQRATDFTVDESGQPPSPRLRLSTVKLQADFQVLIGLGRALPEEQRKQRAQSLQPCLDRARDVLRLVSNKVRVPTLEEPLITFLGLFYELTAAVAGAAFREITVYYGEQHGALEMTSGGPLAVKRLEERKWCPREVWSLIKKYNTTVGYYASFLSNPGRGKDHANCTSLVCSAYNVDGNAEYDYQHVCEDGNCKFGEVNGAKVIQILRDNRIPVVRVVDAAKDHPNLEICEANKETPYIAISHVWSDGLGNPLANAMPSCQIRRINNLCRAPDGTTIAFWIDTLCCPTDPEDATMLAISLMRRTYSEAAAVLVIDAWLTTKRSDILTPEESMLHIMLSGWTRRLWTFQEGMLARQLFVLFADGLINLNEVARAVRSSLECCFLPMKYYLVQDYIRLQGLAKAQGTGRQILYFVVDALRFRSTSVATDEALCLATILGLDFSTIEKELPERRMEQVWSLLTDIPQDIIFLDSPKLKARGLGWAPATLRMPTGTENLFGQLTWNMNKPGGLLHIGKGLEVQCDGLLLGPNQHTKISLGVDIKERRMAEFAFTDQNGIEYKSEILTRLMKVWLADFRGYSSFVENAIEVHGEHFQLMEEDLADLNLPNQDLADLRFVILVRSFDKDLLTADADIGVLAWLRLKGIERGNDSEMYPSDSPVAISVLGHVTVRRLKTHQSRPTGDGNDSDDRRLLLNSAAALPPHLNSIPTPRTLTYSATYLSAQKWCVD